MDERKPYTQSILSPIAGAPEDEDLLFWQLIRQRRSIRRYQSRAIPQPILERILEAAIWAPSAHNRQPWRFCVVTGADAKLALSARMGEQWRQDLSADGADPAFIEKRISVSHARITGAGALIVASVSMEDMDIYPDAKRAEAEWLMAVQSTALACQNLLLAAHHYKLGSCWMCAPLFVPDLVRDVLDLPRHWHPQTLITLGYPAESKEKDRAPLNTRVIWRQ